MKLYVPEIGDKLRLVTPWAFTLHDEQRNQSLWDAIDGDNVGTRKAISDEAIDVFNEGKAFAMANFDPMYWGSLFSDGHTVLYHAYFYNHDEKLLAAFNRFATKQHKLRGDPNMKQIPAALVAGTVLKVDRIFIRKGMEDWSSLTFFMVSSPDPALASKKKIRFWAKLSDCNQIEFDLVT